jgi:BMFP domain-containing protein YqiC|tara:strand:+ start:523 stop:711 length:189 start_codon:yes stop_codon:yes gene_type:complete
LEKLIKTAIKHALDKLEVVDRAEFDVQSEALSKALAHVKELEKEITELRSKIESIAASDQKP